MDPVREFFEPGGQLSSSHPRFEHRPGQQAMAGTVARVLDQGGNVMIEAGTGTGKTLAYLVPALMQDRRVIVSTGTRNLQDQIHDKDLPFLAGEAGLEVSACVMKGRDNYLCRYRLAQFEREPMFEKLDEAEWVPRIAEWSKHTATGDRAEIAEMPDNLRLWRDVNARSDTCGGTRCPEYELCWLTLVKRRAQECQLIVVNHHLFFADLALRSAFGAVLPDYDTVVFDEAHLLEEIATLYFGVQVSSAQFEDLARHAEKLAAVHDGPVKGGGGAFELRDAVREFFLPLRERLEREVGRTRFDPAERGGPDLEAEWATLCEALDGLVRRMPEEADVDDGAESLPRRVDELKGAVSQVIDRSESTFVYGMELRGRANVTLSASPIDVSDLLRDNLFDPLHAAVLTSATLSVEGKFDFFRARLGLDDIEGTVVESSFDYEKQALLYLPRAMPEPRQPEFIDRAVTQLSSLLEISDGRAFLLFTSFANMNRVREALEPLERWPLFVQGDGSKAALVESFRNTPQSVLLGTTSFWHGVDVPGDALSVVIVDKLPFDVPSDPLVAARIDRIRERDGNPFFEYQVPMAVLELKQGLGRLLRSTSDRGIVGILDPRVATRRYGKMFLRSLPPYRVVRDLEDCRQFFRPTDS